MTDEIKCEICHSKNDVRMAPLMTGVPFSAPEDEQRYVCGECIGVWYSKSATTAEEILKIRGLGQ